MRRTSWLLMSLGLWAGPLEAGHPMRPLVDVAAMREAMQSAETDVQYPSSAAYAHFLRARLASHDGQQRRALDELRLASASDLNSAFLMTELAEQYARLADAEHSENELSKVLQIHPNYAPAQLLMGRVLFESKRMARAKSFLKRAIELRPTHLDGYLVLTQLWLDLGQNDEAIEIIDSLGAAIPGEPIGYRRLGLALAERGANGQAERLLELAVERDPGDVESWLALSKLYEGRSHDADALRALERAIERDPESKEVLLALGTLLLRVGQIADATAYFDQLLAVSREPELAVRVAFVYLSHQRLAEAATVLDGARVEAAEPRLHFYAGLVHERNRALAQAIDAFGDVAPSAGDLYYEAQLHLASCLSSHGKHAEALEHFERLSAERSHIDGLELAFARAYERSGQPIQAEKLLVSSFARKPDSDMADALTAFYERSDRISDAIAHFASGLEKKPGDEVLLFALAVAQEKGGQWQAALQTMRSVLVANPANVPAMNFIGYTLADRGGDLQEAEMMVRHALEAKPESAAFLDSMGWVLLKKGDHQRAIEFLERAVAAAPDEPTLFEHLGDACIQGGRRPRAEEAWQRALRLLNENPDAGERVTQRFEIERKLRGIVRRAASRTIAPDGRSSLSDSRFR